MAIREGANTVIYPDRFPFDVLDPAPDYCPGCSCNMAEAERAEDCRNVDCACHQELGPYGLRYRWGDR